MKLSRIRIAGLSLIITSVAAAVVLTSTAPSAARGELFGSLGATTTQTWQSKVDASVLTKATAGPTEFLIYMEKQADLSGADALLISANPKLAGLINRLEDIIEQTAVPKTTTEGCGLDSPTAVPNNTFGWGRIDALAAVLEALPPKAENDFAVTGQRMPVTINALANDTDPDGDQLTITAVGAAAHGSVTNNGNGTLTYTPEFNFKGTDTFVYTICAPEGCLTASSTAAVTVEVRARKK